MRSPGKSRPGQAQRLSPSVGRPRGYRRAARLMFDARLWGTCNATPRRAPPEKGGGNGYLYERFVHACGVHTHGDKAGWQANKLTALMLLV